MSNILLLKIYVVSYDRILEMLLKDFFSPGEHAIILLYKDLLTF